MPADLSDRAKPCSGWRSTRPTRRLITYLISDVPGDDPGTIGSGPTMAGGADP